MTIPRIETGRLILRPHRTADLPAAFAMWSDPDVYRFAGGKASSESQTWMRIVNYAGMWALLGYGYWAVEEKTSGAFAGEAGFADFHRDIDASMRAPEIGWAFGRAFSGRGYATETVRAIVAWGDAHLPHERTVCLIVPENHASARVAEKCGYRQFALGAFAGNSCAFYERAGPAGS